MIWISFRSFPLASCHSSSKWISPCPGGKHGLSIRHPENISLKPHTLSHSLALLLLYLFLTLSLVIVSHSAYIIVCRLQHLCRFSFVRSFHTYACTPKQLTHIIGVPVTHHAHMHLSTKWITKIFIKHLFFCGKRQDYNRLNRPRKKQYRKRKSLFIVVD